MQKMKKSLALSLLTLFFSTIIHAVTPAELAKFDARANLKNFPDAQTVLLYDDQQMRDFFYEIDWSSFTEGELGVENRDFENKADKLLSFFEVLCSMYYRHIITKTDMTLFEYELKRVYDHPDVQAYFDYLKGWQEKQKIGESYVNYKRYCSEHR